MLTTAFRKYTIFETTLFDVFRVSKRCDGGVRGGYFSGRRSIADNKLGATSLCPTKRLAHRRFSLLFRFHLNVFLYPIYIRVSDTSRRGFRRLKLVQYRRHIVSGRADGTYSPTVDFTTSNRLFYVLSPWPCCSGSVNFPIHPRPNSGLGYNLERRHEDVAADRTLR